VDSRNPSLPLSDGARIAVIGGGPAGSFFALSALQAAENLRRRVDVTIFERKDLARAGPAGCNMCAGILSRRVSNGLDVLGVALAPEVVLGAVGEYRLHCQGGSFPIVPADPGRHVVSVYRAGGPVRSPYPRIHGFDDFLLGQAEQRGARIVHEIVDDIALTPTPSVRVAGCRESFDLVVLAIGVNGRLPSLDQLSYVRPRTEIMAQDALLIRTEHMRAQMDGTVHVFFDQMPGLIFGALIPKGNFATVSLLGRRLGKDSIGDFVSLPEIRAVVGELPARSCGCRPRVAVSSAKFPCADGFVAVGDASVSRLYKDGIGSAFLTAHAAAQTALLHGVSRKAFEAGYAPVCRKIERDNRFGRMVFGITQKSKTNAFFMRALTRTLSEEANQPPGERILSQILWSLFTGDADYAAILRSMFRIRSLASLFASR
jgi:flavin-dependent dehydrogenase